MSLPRDTADRTTHAASAGGTVAIVRYEKAGKFRLERANGRSEPLTLTSAVDEAVALEAIGGRIYSGRAGGLRFDAELAKRRKTLPAQ